LILLAQIQKENPDKMSETMEELERDQEKLKDKWENAKRKLTKQIKKKDSPGALDRAKKDMEEKWEKLTECHYKYMLHLTPETKEKEKKTYAELDDEQDEIFEQADQTKVEIEQAGSPSDNALAMRDKTEVEKKRDEFQSLLGNIVVSRKAQQQYLEKLKENEIENWSETSQCKVIHGIDPKFFEEKFLGKDGMFQRASGVDDETMASFEIVVGAGGMSDQMKTFKTKPKKSGNSIGGKYGMYAAFRRSDGSNVIDVAYTVYNFDADLMGTGEMKKKWMEMDGNRRNERKVDGDGDEVTDTGENDSLITRLKVGDVAALTENFIVSKALTAFAQSNVIKKVKWVEDEENEEMQSIEQ